MWRGWESRSGAAANPQAAELFARSAPRDGGTAARYELLAVAARGFRPPRFLSTDPVNADPGEPVGRNAPDHLGLRQVWALLYRRVAETGPAQATPYGIYLLGVDPPPDATPEDLEVFNDFYTNVHLPEVAERRHALRAVRYELADVVKAPYNGPPRFLAVYEVDEEGASNRRHTGPPYTSGPAVWQRHKTPWRLWYRRLLPD